MASESLQMFHDYTLAVSEGPNGEAVSIGGRFYAGDLGFVLVSTIEPLHISADGRPSSGQLRFEGHRSWADMSFGSTAGAYTIVCSDGGLPISGVLN
jgi:hypothetical protein